MAWRVQWREHKAHLKTPAVGEIKFEDGHDQESAAARAAELLRNESLAWLWCEDLEAPHPGNSLSRPKPRTKK